MASDGSYRVSTGLLKAARRRAARDGPHFAYCAMRPIPTVPIERPPEDPLHMPIRRDRLVPLRYVAHALPYGFALLIAAGGCDKLGSKDARRSESGGEIDN